MTESESQLSQIGGLQCDLAAAIFDSNEKEILATLAHLSKQSIDLDILKQTGIGVTVGRLRKHGNLQIKTLALSLVKSWKNLVSNSKGNDRLDGVVPTSAPASPAHSAIQSPGSEPITPKSSIAPKLTAAEVKTGDAVRDKIRTMLAQCLVGLSCEDDRIFVAVQIEDGLFSHFGNTQKGYKNQFRAIMFNLKDKSNPDFAADICSGKINPGELAQMDSKDMASRELKASRADRQQESKQELRSDLNRGMGASDMFKCGRCKKSETTFYQMQTRSADEPMTTFITCVPCGNRWRM